MGAVTRRRAVEGLYHGRAQILADHADFSGNHDVSWARRVVGGDGHAGGESLDHDQAEGVGPAGKTNTSAEAMVLASSSPRR